MRIIPELFIANQNKSPEPLTQVTRYIFSWSDCELRFLLISQTDHEKRHRLKMIVIDNLIIKVNGQSLRRMFLEGAQHLIRVLPTGTCSFQLDTAHLESKFVTNVRIVQPLDHHNNTQHSLIDKKSLTSQSFIINHPHSPPIPAIIHHISTNLLFN